MNSETIEKVDYKIHYDAQLKTIKFTGELSLNGAAEYDPIKTFLDNIVESDPGDLILNLKQLEFLNSSGISLITKFVIGLRKKPEIHLTVEGSVDIPWQSKSLKNLKKFLPDLELIVE